MLRNRLSARLIASTAIGLLLASCGGGGGSSPPDGTGVITPSPTPAPPPSATPTPPASPFGALGQTQSREFITLGFSYRAADGGLGYSPDPNSYATDRPVGLRYVAQTQRLWLAIGGFGEGIMTPNGSGGFDGQGRTTQLGYSVLSGTVDLGAPSHPGGGYLSSTGWGSWVSQFSGGSAFPYLLVEFVYGVPTSVGNMPQSGTGTYEPFSLAPRLTVDFAARTVTGSITLGEAPNATVFTLQDVKFTPDGTGFSGRAVSADPARDAVIDGRFTGPNANEMMARFVVSSNQGFVPLIWAAVRR
jgi:hypothetical protein